MFIMIFFLFTNVKMPTTVGTSAEVLDKLPVPGRPSNLDNSRAKAYCAYSSCGLGLFVHFFSYFLLPLCGKWLDIG